MNLLIRRRALCVLTVWLMSDSFALAATTNWNTDANGVFTVASNWSSGVPSSSDTAVFRRGDLATYTVTVNGAGPTAPLLDHPVDRLVVGGNTVNLQRNSILGSTSITAGNTSTGAANRGIVVGELAGEHAVLNSSVPMTAVATTIGDAANATGTWNLASNIVTITGTTGNANTVIVGNSGQGTLSITNTGSFVMSGDDDLVIGANSGSTGSVTVSGAGASLNASNNSVIVGSSGSGSLSVSNGAMFSTSFLLLGNKPGSNADATISDTSAKINLLGLGIEGTNGGPSRLLVAGSQVQSFEGNISGGPSATAFMDMTSSTWTLASTLNIGQTIKVLPLVGTSQMNISGNSTVSSSDATVACPVGSTCLVNFQDSTWNVNGNLNIAVNDQGQALGAGTVSTSTGGNLVVSGDTTISTGGILNHSLGTLTASTITLNGGAFNWQSGTLHVGVFNASLTTPNGGILAPGAEQSAGSTVVDGDYAQHAGGTLQIGIGGHSAGGDSDLVGIIGHAILGGDLELDLLHGFTPSATDTFTILNAGGGIFGVFDNVTTGERLAAADGLGSFIVNYGAGSAFNQNEIVLSGFQAMALPGDFNQNGVVDAADYVVWRNNSGTSNVLHNDAIGGVIGQAQYDEWRAHFGQTVASGAALADSSSVAVPEPSCATLLLLASGAHGVLGRRVRYSLAHRTAK